MGRKALNRAAHRRVQEAPTVAPQPTEEPKTEAPGIPGMKSETWSGVPMFRCMKCDETFFDPEKAKDHACKEIKFAPEGDE